MTDARTRHSRGLWVVIALGAIFFALLGLIILKSGGRANPDDEIKASENLTVLPVRIRIRTEPHANAPVVATATTGEQVKLLEDRGAWVRVETNDNLAGWAERANLERTGERARRIARYKAIRNLPSLAGVSHERTPLYAGPGIFYPLVGEIDDGAKVTVYTRDHDFYAIEHDGAVAYADIDAIDVTAAGSRQLDVRTAPTSTQRDDDDDDDDDEPAPTETVAETGKPEPEPEPEVTAPEPVERSTGVYAAVPPGGTQPQELDRVVPRYPAAARARGVQGAVVVRGIVRRDGTIDNVEILKDLPYGLGDAARDAVRRWRFRPATLRGEPIDVYYTVTVNFKLQ